MYVFLIFSLVYGISFVGQAYSKEMPIPGTEVPEEYKDITDGQWEVFADDKGELKNEALENAEYQQEAIDENDDSMSQFNEDIINEEVESGRYR